MPQKRLSLQKDIIEAKMTSVAAKQIKAEAEERVKKTAKLSEAVLNKACVYPVFGPLGQHPSKLSFGEKSRVRRPLDQILVKIEGETWNKKLGITENENELAKNGHSDRGARLLSKSLNLDSRKRWSQRLTPTIHGASKTIQPDLSDPLTKD